MSVGGCRGYQPSDRTECACALRVCRVYAFLMTHICNGRESMLTRYGFVLGRGTRDEERGMGGMGGG